MSDSWVPWSNSSNAPQIPSVVYFAEKEAFAGMLLEAILYGVFFTLFVSCMVALLNSGDRAKRDVRWGLVAYTMATFSFLTIALGIDIYLDRTFFIDNREFPGNDLSPPGPLGYSDSITYDTIDLVYFTLYPLTQWLNDGFLLHRCFVIYSMNYYILAFPCLIYLATVAIGIAFTYQSFHPVNGGLSISHDIVVEHFGTSYYSISLAFNVLVTLMIVARLVLHNKNVRSAIGTSSGISGLYTTIVTMLVESCALYAAGSLVLIVPWAIDSPLMFVFSKVSGMMQAIAPLLITLRVANRRALTSNMITSGSGNVGSLQFGGRDTTDDCETSDGDPTSSIEGNDEVPDASGTSAEKATEEAPL